MNRIFIAFVLVVAVYAEINPQSQDIPLPEQLTGGRATETLVTDNFGVVAYVNNGQSVLTTFSVGSSFAFDNNTEDGANLGACSPQLIDVDAESFIVYCGEGSEGVTQGSYLMYLISVDGLALISNKTEVFSTGNQIALPSYSAFVTVKGNVYLATPQSNATMNISIFEFNVPNLSSTLVIGNVVNLIPGAAGSDWTLQDLHSLPFDAGVSVILNADDLSRQVFASIYFNGTVVVHDIPEGVFLEFVGRHRGSSFGYTVGAVGNTPYSVVTAWDFSVNSFNNNVTLKGFSSNNLNGHFATSESVFVYTDASEGGYIYELPYSENGFLINSVSSVEVDSTFTANLGSGVDGTYIYAIVSNDGDSDSLNRYSY